MAVQARASFTLEPTSPGWLIHALVAEVVERLRNQPGVQAAYTLWPSPTALTVNVRHAGQMFGPLDDLLLRTQHQLETTLTGQATLTGTGTTLVAA